MDMERRCDVLELTPNEMPTLRSLMVLWPWPHCFICWLLPNSCKMGSVIPACLVRLGVVGREYSRDPSGRLQEELLTIHDTALCSQQPALGGTSAEDSALQAKWMETWSSCIPVLLWGWLCQGWWRIWGWGSGFGQYRFFWLQCSYSSNFPVFLSFLKPQSFPFHSCLHFFPFLLLVSSLLLVVFSVLFLPCLSVRCSQLAPVKHIQEDYVFFKKPFCLFVVVWFALFYVHPRCLQ